jgi:hypothetical protein
MVKYPRADTCTEIFRIFTQYGPFYGNEFRLFHLAVKLIF